MRCIYFRKTMPQRGKKKYHADCLLVERVEQRLQRRGVGRQVVGMVTESFTQPAPMSEVLICVESTKEMTVAMLVYYLYGMYQVTRVESETHVVIRNLDVEGGPRIGDVIRAGEPIFSWTTIGDFEKFKELFKMHGTVTGRLSSSRPNLQNLSRPDRDKMKMARFAMAYGTAGATVAEILKRGA